MSVRFTPLALHDLDTVGDWIARDDPDRARSFTKELRQKAIDIGGQPRIYPLAPFFGTREVRRRLHKGYLIFYDLIGGDVRILRVLHGARDYRNLL